MAIPMHRAPGQVLIVSHLFEPSVDRVIQHFESRGVPWARLNCEEFPLACAGEIRTGAQGSTSGVLRFNDRIIDSRDVSTVWFRRVSKHPLPQGLCATDRDFAQNECSAFLSGFLDLAQVRWVNDRPAERRANSKLTQLRLAQQVGLRIPATLITNDPVAVRNFASTINGPVIFKPVSGYAPRGADFSREFAARPEVQARFQVEVTDDGTGEADLVFSQLLTPDKLERIQSIAFCPAQFQEYVPKRVELRITIVGKEIFTCEIHSQKLTQTQVDFRRMVLLDSLGDLDHRPHELAPEIADRLLELMRLLGLAFGCVDMILTPDEEHVFLEINPSGQWLWVEQLTGAAISDALASLLSGSSLSSST